MPLRFKALIYWIFNSIFLKKILLLILLAFFQPAFSQTNIEDTKKEANRLFEDDEFTGAYKLYAQLVANYPKDPVYNFRLGVCMIYSEPDKKKCLTYLQSANNKPDCPKETKFYLGKAYHINYLFDDAIKYYNEYKKVGSSSQQKKLQVDNEIKACGNGKRLLSNLSDLVVQSKKTLNEADYFRSYDLKDVGGKLLTKPDDFRTSPDKKKKDKSIVYLPKTGDRVYFSSYGPNTDNGRDIYYKTKLPNGEFSAAVKVNGINTEFDEDYPFLHPNGTTLYFASKGHNSMGGYDIFKSTYLASSDSWTSPENLEFPVNSPDDDFLYVTDSLEKTAYFSTGRQSLPGKIDVLKINTERKPIDILAIKGTVLKESSDQSLKSIITVKNTENDKVIGTYNAQDNGDYVMDLPNGAKLLFTVETPGLQTQADKVLLPMVATSKPLKQAISYDKGILKIINYFDEAPSEDSYIQYLKIIEKKAKLDVNSGQNNLDPTLIAAGNDPAKKQNGLGNTTDSNGRPTVIEDTLNKTSPTNTAVATSTNQSLNNKALSDLAKQDAQEAIKDAVQLKQDAADALVLGEQKKIEADKKLAAAEDSLKNAQAITDEGEKNSAIERATALKTEAEGDQNIAGKILNYAKALETDANNKQIIANLNNEYVTELDKVITSKNNSPQAIEKLDGLQKQIAEISGKKSESELLYNAIKNDVDEKEKEISKIEQTNNDVKNNLQEIKTAITSSESELAGTKKKKDKEPIQTKITELKAEQIEKEKQIEANETEIKKQNDDLSNLKSGLALATKIKNETIAAPVNTTAIVQGTNASGTNSTAITATNTQAANVTLDKITSKTLSEKYKDKILTNNSYNKTDLEANNIQLKNYNKDIDGAVAKNKTDLGKAKTPQQKQDITKEIKLLEATKKQNQQIIANNNKIIEDLFKPAATNTAVAQNAPDLNPIISNNPKEAVNQLNTLNTKLSSNDNNNFEYNGYQNPQSQNLKIEADAKINDVALQQKKLKDLIAGASEQIKNSAPTNTTPPANSANDLFVQSENEMVKAQQLRTEAAGKSGTEKDDLITKAKEIEDKANEIHLQASTLLQKDNKTVFDTNTENIETLKKQNKASDPDLNEVSRLMDESNAAFKKAAVIREEGNSMPNIGAKLGNISNAEEIEAEAINKQQQALFILKKSASNVALKTAVTSENKTAANNSAPTGTVDLTTQLQSVNTAIKELADTKAAAYQKLFEANKMELDLLSANLKTNQATIDKTPSLKSDWIAGTNKITKSETFKQNSDAATDNNAKVNDLIAATKLQVEALNQLSTLNKNLTQTLAGNPPNNGGNETAKTNTTGTNGNDGGNETAKTNTTGTNGNDGGNETAKTNTTGTNGNDGGNETAKTNTTGTNGNDGGNETAKTNTTGTNGNDGGNETAKTNTTGTNGNDGGNETAKTNTTTNGGNETGPAKVIDVQELAKTDTTTADMVTYLENKKTTLKNPGANQLVTNSINDLKKAEEENKNIENQIKSGSSGNSSGETPTILASKAEKLLIEAEELGVKAFDLKTLSNSKEGAEKDTLLAQSKNLEELSVTKKLEAATLTQQGNQANYTNNNSAITELMDKVKTDNPDLAAQLEQKNIDIATLNSQAQQLRTEANSQTNKNAQVGSLANAEEKESEMLKKQNEVIAELKKQYPDFVLKEPSVSNTNTSTPEDLKVKQTQVREKQFKGLTDLTNAYSLEYETSKDNVPANLNDNQKAVKQNADDLNAESKRLLIKSTQETNENEKIKLLTLAAKTGNAAVDQLNKISGNKVVAVNDPPRNGGNNPPRNAGNDPAVTNNPGRGTVKIEGLEVIAGSAYNNNKPIPIDAPIPNGLTFRVQIGAFRTALPNNTFRGLSPLNGENASNGYIRYTAGNFNKVENANAVKNDLRGLGYSDAFVVAYYNGKRISYNEALDILAKEGKTIDPNASQTAGITANINVPKAINNPRNPNLNALDNVSITKELDKVNGLLFTVQIGVYTKEVNNRQLFGLKPIYSEKLPTGLYRYTAGIYNNVEKLITDKNKVVDLGVRDAFVSAYLNGKKITIAEGKVKQQDSTTKMEAENPIVFPDPNVLNIPPVINNLPGNNNPPANNNPTNPVNPVRPFTNGVSGYPAATEENGIKAGQDGVCFKVQIGAYSRQVPNDVAAKFSAIKNWPIENKQINNLFIYNVGNYSASKFAKALLSEAKAAGITDAFISVFKDGRKLSGAEANALIGQ